MIISIEWSECNDGFNYDIYEDETAQENQESIDGGLCTGTRLDAVDMALSHAKELAETKKLLPAFISEEYEAREGETLLLMCEETGKEEWKKFEGGEWACPKECKGALLCTAEGCDELQGADAEFCEAHYPKRG